MDYMKYATIQVLKKSDRSEVIFAAVEEMDVPVVVKHLKGANPEIYQSISKIKNPHIPRIHCVEEEDDGICIVEEYIDGRTLNDYIEEEKITDIRKMELMVQLCEALEVLHHCKPAVIHRDIKPSNILVTWDGILKLIDFDASRQYKAEKNTSDTRLLGTIEYAAPEQFGYAQTDVRSDVYSLGVVFSEIRIEDMSCVKRWKRVVDKCTSFDPDNRYDNVSQLKKDILKCIERGKRPCWKRMALPVLGCAIILVLLMLAGMCILGKRETEIPDASMPTPTQVPATPTPSQNPTPTQVPATPTPSPSPTPTQVPATPTPSPSPTPTQVPATPTPSPSPTPTQVPATPTPSPTPTPRPTYAPEDMYPWQRYPSVGETGVVRKHKVLKGKWTEIAGYLPSNMDYKDSYDVDYRINDSGSLWMKPHKIYGSVNFELRDVINMEYCDEIVVRMKNEVGDIAIVLYDEDYRAVETLYYGKTEGACEVHFNTTYGGNIEYIGFLANDGELMDYSEFETVIYYVDFHIVNPDSPKYSYKIADMTEHEYYYLEREYNEDGSVHIEYNHIYGELMLSLPEPVDMRECKVIGVKMDSKYQVTMTYYDKDFNPLSWSCENQTDGVHEELYDPINKYMIYGVGLMTEDHDLEDYSDCEATFYEVNFYLKPPYE